MNDTGYDPMQWMMVVAYGITLLSGYIMVDAVTKFDPSNLDGISQVIAGIILTILSAILVCAVYQAVRL